MSIQDFNSFPDFILCIAPGGIAQEGCPVYGIGIYGMPKDMVPFGAMKIIHIIIAKDVDKNLLDTGCPDAVFHCKRRFGYKRFDDYSLFGKVDIVIYEFLAGMKIRGIALCFKPVEY